MRPDVCVREKYEKVKDLSIRLVFPSPEALALFYWYLLYSCNELEVVRIHYILTKKSTFLQSFSVEFLLSKKTLFY